MSATPELRPLRIGEVLDTAIAVYRRNAADLIRIVAVVVAPVQVLLLLVVLAVGDEFVDTAEGATGPADAETLVGAMVGFGVIALLYSTAALLAVAACSQAVGLAYLGEPVPWKASLRDGVRRIGGLLLLYLMVLVVIVLPAFALTFVSPVLTVLALLGVGAYVVVATPIATAALVVERIAPWKALRRAVALLRRRFWPVTGTLALTFVLLLLVQGVVSAVFGMLGAFAGGGVASTVLSAVGDVAAGLLTTPLLAAVSVVAYVDLRVRAEGLDVELLARSIGGPTGPDAPAGPTGDDPPVRW